MWSRGGDHRWLEAALRSRRVDPPERLVSEISARVFAPPDRHGRAWSRVAFASAASVFVVGTFASFGGLGYASSGASSTYNAVSKIVVVHKLKVVVPESAAVNQYRHHSYSKPAAFTPPKTGNTSGVKAAIKVQGQTLPFTGFSLLGTLLASLGLIGAGIFLRRREHRS